MATIYQPFTEYRTDGIQRQFTFGFPYLSRSHVMVTRNGGAPALFKWVDDHTLDIHTLFNEPLPFDEPVKIFRQTPDLDAFAEFKDAALMTKDDLNRARLQVLYLIQERSGGLAGSVSVVVQTLTNEIETLSGALDGLAYSQGQLLAGLQTLDDLAVKLGPLEDAQAALQQLIDDTVAGLNGTVNEVVQRLDAVEVRQGNLESAVNSQITTLIGNDMAFAARVDTVEAKIDSIDTGDGDDDSENTDIIAASVIMSAIAEAKSHYSQAKSIEQLKAQYGDAEALIQQERTVRAEADSALAQQITALQATIGENIAQVIEDIQTSVDLVEGKVATVAANYTLKVMAQRQDGKQVMAGIGLNATASNDYTGSEIVMSAQRLVFVDSSNPNGPLKPMFMSGNVDGSPTFVIPSNVMGDRMYPGRLMVDGSIEGRSVAANTITGDKIRAGAITAREIDVSLGTNLLVNATLIGDTSGWNMSSNIVVTSAGLDLLGSAWKMTQYGALVTYQAGADFNGWSIGDRFTSWDSVDIPCDPGQNYEFSAYTGAHRCQMQIILIFLNASGTQIGGASAGELNNAQAAGGQTLGTWKRLFGWGVAPAGSASMRLLVRKSATLPGQSDSYGIFTMPSISAVGPNVTRPSAWGPSGLGTKITPAGISTPSLSALTANIGTLVSYWPDGGRVERDGNGTRIYAPNGVMVVQLGRW